MPDVQSSKCGLRDVPARREGTVLRVKTKTASSQVCGGDLSGDLLDCAFVTYSPGAKQKCQYRRRGFVPSGTQCYAWALDGAGGRESVSRRSDVSHKRIGKRPTMAVLISSKNG